MSVAKPITMLREEFAANLAMLINASDIPAFVIRPILQDVLTQVEMLEKQQYEHAKMQYEAELRKEDENNAESEE